jgi:hypothetical protein
MFDIQEELKALPDNPGVYLMKNAFGEIIYVGKAKNLKKRVRQYFQSKNHIPKIQAMIKNISEFEIRVSSVSFTFKTASFERLSHSFKGIALTTALSDEVSLAAPIYKSPLSSNMRYPLSAPAI